MLGPRAPEVSDMVEDLGTLSKIEYQNLDTIADPSTSGESGSEKFEASPEDAKIADYQLEMVINQRIDRLKIEPLRNPKDMRMFLRKFEAACTKLGIIESFRYMA